jgi:hypothetical protein
MRVRSWLRLEVFRIACVVCVWVLYSTVRHITGWAMADA